MSTKSYRSPYDKSETYRTALVLIREHKPELGVDLRMKMASAIADAIQKSQVLPLLTNLAAVSQALDVLGIPSAVRTDEHPDIIDQMSSRLPYLLNMAFPAGEDVILHELLDVAALSRSDALGRTLTVPERLKSGIDELLIRRELASKLAESTAKKTIAPTELIAVSPTRPLPIHETISALIEQMMPLIAIDPRLTARIEEISSRFAAMAADQGTMRHQVDQLHRLVTDRLGKDRQLRQDIDRGFTRIEHKITQVERAAKVTAQMNDRQHAQNREQIVALERQTVALKQQIVALTKAVSEPREDTAEILLREALGGSEVAEVLRQINQRAMGGGTSTNQPASASVIVAERPSKPAKPMAKATPAKPKDKATPAKPPDHPGRFLLGAVLSLLVIVAALGFGLVPLASTTAYPATNPIAKAQEYMAWQDGAPIPAYISEAYQADGAIYLRRQAISAFTAWVDATPRPISPQLYDALTGLKDGKTPINAGDKVNPKYGFPTDAVSVMQWQNFLGMLVTEKSRNAKFDDALAHKTAKVLDNWLRGYQTPNDRRLPQAPTYSVPTTGQQYAVTIMAAETMSANKTLCLSPLAIKNLIAKHVPVGQMTEFACPVQHLTPAFATKDDPPTSHYRKLALSSPSKFWDQTCLKWPSAQAITDYHNLYNVPIAEIKLRQCR